MRAVIALSFALLAACSPAADDETAREARYQKELEAASAEARAHLDYFWEHQAAPTETEYDFLLKVALTPASGGEEHVWVDQVSREGEAITGQLANAPALLEDLKEGDVVTFAEADVTDWAFFSGERLYGHYTTRVMLPRLPAEQAEAMRSMFGENPD